MLLRILRLLVGALFIFSGMVKLNDPMGFSFKLTEYFTKFSMKFLEPVTLYLAIIICVVEVIAGLMLIIGYKPKLVSWVMLLTIIFFTFLTGFTYVTGYVNPAAYDEDARKEAIIKKESLDFWQEFNEGHMLVNDCGCFGDAIPLKPKESFIKDLVLLALILYIFKKRKEIVPVYAESPSMNLSIASGVISLGFGIYCYLYMPIKDFRPYKAGTNIVEGMKIPPGAPTDSFAVFFQYHHQVTGQDSFCDANHIPWQDTNWVVDMRGYRNIKVREGYKPEIHDFVATDKIGADITEDLLKEPNALLIISYNMDKASVEDFKAFKQYESLQQKGYKIYVWTSTLIPTAEKKLKEAGLSYPILNGDQTMLKTVIRSNPGLTYLKKGVVAGHYGFRRLPSPESLK